MKLGQHSKARVDGSEQGSRLALRRPARPAATMRAVGTSSKESRLEHGLNKRKKVAWRKHRIRRKKLEEKRQIGTLARRK